MSLKDLLASADWRVEKHVPLIEAPEVVKKSMPTRITVTIGKEIAHPNTTEHHLSWIEVYFLPDGEKFPYLLGRFEITAHGASVQGPNTSTIFTVPEVVLNFKTDKSGTLLAAAYCNIHGLWENSQKIKVE
jgi:superoxide reductase